MPWTSDRLVHVAFLAVFGAACDDGVCRGVCETVLVVEHVFEPTSPSVTIDICDGPYCRMTSLSEGDCEEPPIHDDRGFVICYEATGVWATRRFYYERRELPVENYEVSLRITDAEGTVLLDASGLPELTDNESCIGSCPRRTIAF